MNNKLLKDSLLYTIGEVVPRAISFILLPIYTTFLTPSDYGILSYTNSATLFIFAFAALSLNTFVLRTFFNCKSEDSKKRLIGNIFLFMMFSNIIFSSLFFVFTPKFLELSNSQIPWNPYFKLAIINNFLEGFSIIPLVFYRVRQNAKLFVILSISRVTLQAILTYTFIVILDWGLIGNYYGRLFSLLPFTLIYIGIILKNSSLNINIQQIKQGIKFSFPLIPGTIAYLLVSMFDRIILERHVALSEIGIYNIAYTLVFALNMLVQSTYRAIEPEIFKKYGSADFEDFIRKSKAFFLAIIYFAGISLAIFSKEIFTLIASEEYLMGYKLVPIILISIFMTAHNVFYGGILIAEKRTKVAGRISIISAVVSVGLNFLLIPIIGVYGAAISSGVAFALMTIMLYIKIEYKENNMLQEVSFFLVFLLSLLLINFINQDISITSIFLKTLLLALIAIVFYKVHISKYDILKIIKQKKNS